MTPYYNTPERIAALHAEALTWLGTPFRTNGRAKGKAVDCHNLCYAIQRHTGAWPEFEVPRGKSGIAGQLQVRRMSNFLETRPESVLVKDRQPLPGDIVTGNTVGGEYHMGLYLGTVNGQPHTVIMASPRGVTLSTLADPTLRHKIVAVWRPIETAQTTAPAQA